MGEGVPKQGGVGLGGWPKFSFVVNNIDHTCFCVNCLQRTVCVEGESLSTGKTTVRFSNGHFYFVTF